MWYHITTMAIGGLENIGFADSGNIIILSSQGRGIISSTTGEIVFRDNMEWWEDFNEAEGAIPGFGGEANTAIKLFGFHTEGELRKSTKCGWRLVEEEGRHGTIPVQKFYLRHNDLTERIFIGEDGPCELRAYGFSEDEKLMVIATSCELVVWAIRKDNKE
jgi:hypothetical protein